MSDRLRFRLSRRALLTALGATAAGCAGAPRQAPTAAAHTARARTPAPAADPRAAGLDAALERAHRAGTFDGVVVAAERGRTFYERGFGLADRAARLANGPETRFPLASIAKQMTALLVLQFVDEGHLDLDAPVERALPGFRGGRPEGITTRHLLMHTSGLPDPDAVPGFLTERDPSKLRPEAVLAGPLAGPLLSAPGAQFRYNNGDYWALGALCERLGGAPFAALLERRILGPLGLKSAGLFVDDAPVTGLAKSYERGAAGPAEAIRLANLYAAGALYGTARDVLRWDEALRSHRLLSKRMTDVMFTADKRKGFVALGSWVYEHRFPRAASAPLLIERQGEVSAFRHLNVIAPREETVVIVLSNGGEPELFKLYANQGLSFELLALVFDDGARRSAMLPPTWLRPRGRDLVGTMHGTNAVEAREHQAPCLRCTPGVNTALKRTQLLVGERTRMLLLKPREEFLRGPLGLGFEPGAHGRPHLFERIFMRAPVAWRARESTMGWPNLALLPRRRETLDEGVYFPAGRLGYNGFARREPRTRVTNSSKMRRLSPRGAALYRARTA